MNRTTKIALPIFLYVALAVSAMHAQQIEVYFSPHSGIATRIALVINGATETVDGAIYNLSHPTIANALAQATARGVRVRLVVDRTQVSGHYSSVPNLAKTPVDVRVDRNEPIHHNKYLVVDSKILITGSANWTLSANAKNAENILILAHTPTALCYAADFVTHWNHSVPFSLYSHFSTKRVPHSAPVSSFYPRPQRKDAKQWH